MEQARVQVQPALAATVLNARRIIAMMIQMRVSILWKTAIATYLENAMLTVNKIRTIHAMYATALLARQHGVILLLALYAMTVSTAL
jgi:hypothetical protein